MKLSTSAALLAAILASIPLARAADGEPAGKAFDVDAALGQQWKEKLGFTAVQSQKYADAQKSKADALRPLRGRLSDALKKIRDLVAAKAADADVSAALKERAEAQDGIADANKKFDAALASFLTATQRAKILVGTPLGEVKTEGAADKRTADLHEALTDGDLEQE